MRCMRDAWSGDVTLRECKTFQDALEDSKSGGWMCKPGDAVDPNT